LSVPTKEAGRLAIDGQEIRSARGIAGTDGETRTIALRPEALTLGAATRSSGNSLQGTIEDVSFLGAIVRIKVRLTGATLWIDTFNNPATRLPDRGAPTTVSFAPEDVQVLEAT
jgi:putative spermidine/putrescine transport system ATP-binding protein